VSNSPEPVDRRLLGKKMSALRRTVLVSATQVVENTTRTMANERITEGIVRDYLREHETKGQLVEEQVTRDPVIALALTRASKQGSGGGRPEFIVTNEALWPDGAILFECKASADSHESARHKAGAPSTPADVSGCAVDGVLHYAKHVAKQRNVIAIAVSGEKKSKLRVSVYRYLKGADGAQPLLDRDGSAVDRLRSFAEYVEFFRFDPSVVDRSLDRLLAHTRDVHDFLRDYGKVTESEKPLVISAVLLALRHAPFRTAWRVAADEDLASELVQAVEKVAKKAISNTKRELMMAAYDFLTTHPELTKRTTIKIKGAPELNASPLRYLVQDIEREVLPFAESYPHFDVIGQFYAEFLRYTGGDGKGLGIVLTPRHLTELFVQIAQVSKKDTVLDPCAGTGGFLISAMVEMDRQAGDNDELKLEIRENQLIGIEQQPAMFALCVSNMVLRGDGRSNLHRGDCFDSKLQQQITQPKRGGMQRPTKGLINPPYSQEGAEQHELDFVKAMLDMLAPGGIGVAVVPMSCAIAQHPARKRLMDSHTLVAAMSLNDELFYPVGVVTCALVWRAHAAHDATNAPTWFGYWKDDGFVKIKHRGRVDFYNKWEAIRDGWLNDFRGMSEAPGRCVKRRVTTADEWCAEAYLETDYSALRKEAFEKVMREHALFVLGQNLGEDAHAEVE